MLFTYNQLKKYLDTKLTPDEIGHALTMLGLEIEDMKDMKAPLADFIVGEIVECIPQKRFVEPIEVANLVKYLISDEAKGITGQSINLCAGLSVGY